MARRRRRIPGFIPWLGKALLRGARWCLFHPQPLMALAISLACLLGLWGFATRSDAFRLMTIQLPPRSSLAVSESLIGQNLWAIDLKALAEKLKAQQPQLKRVRAIRRLPNTLQIEVLERTPVAQVRLLQWHVVDGEGFIFLQASSRPWEDLVILRGVESPREPLKAGHQNPSERLRLALRLVAQLRRSAVLIGHRLSTVDVGDPKQLRFEIDDDLEIRCGSEEELSTHLARLRAVLRRVARQQLAIHYIDVRFDEPVIGPRT